MLNQLIWLRHTQILGLDKPSGLGIPPYVYLSVYFLGQPITATSVRQIHITKIYLCA